MMRWLQTPFEEMDGKVRIRQNVISVERVSSYLGEHVFQMKGRIETFTDRFPLIDLRATFEDNKVRMEPLDMIQVRGSAAIHGVRTPYRISGNLDVIQALWS